MIPVASIRQVPSRLDPWRGQLAKSLYCQTIILGWGVLLGLHNVQYLIIPELSFVSLGEMHTTITLVSSSQFIIILSNRKIVTETEKREHTRSFYQ